MAFASPAWVHQDMVCSWCGTTNPVSAFGWTAADVLRYRCPNCPQSRPKTDVPSARAPRGPSASTAKGEMPTLFEVMEKAQKASRRGRATDAGDR